MQKTSMKLCKTCKHSWTSGASGLMVCEYILHTRKRRGCNVGECDKYEKSATKKVPKWLRGNEDAE